MLTVIGIAIAVACGVILLYEVVILIFEGGFVQVNLYSHTPYFLLDSMSFLYQIRAIHQPP